MARHLLRLDGWIIIGDRDRVREVDLPIAAAERALAEVDTDEPAPVGLLVGPYSLHSRNGRRFVIVPGTLEQLADRADQPPSLALRHVHSLHRLALEGASWSLILRPWRIANFLLAFCDMRTLYLRNVPDDVVERLERLAARDGTSVGAVAIRELADVSRRADNPGLLGALPDLGLDPLTILEDLDAGRVDR